MRRFLCMLAILSFSLFACQVEEEEPVGTQGEGEQEVQIQEQEAPPGGQQSPQEQDVQIQEQEAQPQEQEIQPQQEQQTGQ